MVAANFNVKKGRNVVFKRGLVLVLVIGIVFSQLFSVSALSNVESESDGIVQNSIEEQEQVNGEDEKDVPKDEDVTQESEEVVLEPPKDSNLQQKENSTTTKAKKESKAIGIKAVDEDTLQNEINTQSSVDLDTLFPGHATKTITLTKPLIVTKDITITGNGWKLLIDEASATSSSFRHIVVSNNKKLALVGLSLTGLGNDIKSGGIEGEYGVTTITVTLKDATVENNYVQGNGGGIKAGTVIMDNSNLKNNKATSSGGGMYVASKITLNDSRITGNTITEGTNSQWTAQTGAGITVYAYQASDSIIKNSVISDNILPDKTGYKEGGGLYFGANANHTLRIEDSTLDGNSAERGAGLLFYGNKLFLNNTTIKNNTASDIGGGIVFRKQDMSSSYSDTLEITGGEISGNKASNGGGLAFMNTDVPAAIINGTSFSGNEATNGGIDWDPANAERNQFTREANSYWELLKKAYASQISNISKTSMPSTAIAPLNPLNNNDVQTSNKFAVYIAALGGQWQIPETAGNTEGKESSFDPGCYVNTTYKGMYYGNEIIQDSNGKFHFSGERWNGSDWENYSEEEMLTKDGYYIEGWYKRYDPDTDTYSNKFDIKNETLHESVTLFPKWVKATINKVTFDTDGGKPVPVEQNVTGGDFAKEPTQEPTKTGYKFQGWYTEASGKGAKWNFETDIVTKDMTLYASWTKNNYIVHFEEEGGSTHPKDQTVAYGECAKSPGTVSRTGYVLEGWYTEKNGQGTKWDFDKNQVTKETILYAYWKASEKPLPPNPKPEPNPEPDNKNKTKSGNNIKTGDETGFFTGIYGILVISLSSLAVTRYYRRKKDSN